MLFFVLYVFHIYLHDIIYRYISSKHISMFYQRVIITLLCMRVLADLNNFFPFLLPTRLSPAMVD